MLRCQSTRGFSCQQAMIPAPSRPNIVIAKDVPITFLMRRGIAFCLGVVERRSKAQKMSKTSASLVLSFLPVRGWIAMAEGSNDATPLWVWLPFETMAVGSWRFLRVRGFLPNADPHGLKLAGAALLVIGVRGFALRKRDIESDHETDT
jgi:hypothetical protein